MIYCWTKRLLAVLVLFSSAAMALGQEQYIPLSRQLKNTAIQTPAKSRHLKQQTAVSLPFVDDFARPQSTPTAELWTDQYATINNQYVNAFYTIGIATLDAFDQDGYLYQGASQNSFPADTLTSQPVDLSYIASDSLYLSFFFLPKGLLDAPEAVDSLIVEFYAPTQGTWQTVWYANFNMSSSDTTLATNNLLANRIQKRSGALCLEQFHPVMLPIKAEQYLQSGFRFRFRNRASISYDDDLQSRTGNVDLWHLDMVYLNRDRTQADSVIDDVAISRRLNPLLRNYRSLPWSHFSRANAYEMYDSIFVTYRNTGNQTINFSREFAIVDLYNNNPPYTFTGGTGDDIAPGVEETYPRRTNYIFPFEEEQDSAAFRVTAWLVTDEFAYNQPYRWNDTISYVHKFKNYYAYDDGTAEGGYGLSGAGTRNGEVMVKFQSYKRDSLQGINFYFNKSLNQSNQVYFTLVIREVQEDGMPGEIIYEQPGNFTEYTEQTGAFTYYPLEEPFLIEGSFYLGWRKTSEEMLNVGLDLNTENDPNRYYLLNGNWSASAISGALLMRPVMGRKDLATHTEEVPLLPTNQGKVYPNPASNYLEVDLPEKNIDAIKIIDSSGRLCKQWQQPVGTLSVADLREGIYLLIISQGNRQITHKIIISR